MSHNFRNFPHIHNKLNKKWGYWREIIEVKGVFLMQTEAKPNGSSGHFSLSGHKLK